jgi:hypothetical protein
MKGLEPAARASLVAVIEHDLEAVARIAATLHELAPAAGYEQCAGVAYAIHNLYCALENSFEQISRSFENHVVDREQWHRELMLKMFLQIPGVRPRVFPASARPLLNELRSFRHIFRHSYDYQLLPERLNALIASWRAGGPEVLLALRQFTAWLRQGGPAEA